MESSSSVALMLPLRIKYRASGIDGICLVPRASDIEQPCGSRNTVRTGTTKSTGTTDMPRCFSARGGIWRVKRDRMAILIAATTWKKLRPRAKTLGYGRGRHGKPLQPGGRGSTYRDRQTGERFDTECHQTTSAGMTAAFQHAGACEDKAPAMAELRTVLGIPSQFGSRSRRPFYRTIEKRMGNADRQSYGELKEQMSVFTTKAVDVTTDGRTKPPSAHVTIGRRWRMKTVHNPTGTRAPTWRSLSESAGCKTVSSG